MTIEEAIRIVAEKYNLSYESCKLAYKSMYRFIYEHIKELPLKQNLTDEQFNALRPNFNVPHLGKFFVTLEDYKRVKSLITYVDELKTKEDDIQDL